LSWKVHGEWQMLVHRPLLVYQVRGAWNEEGAHAFTRDCGRIGAPMFGTRWAVLGDLREWQLATMDCIPIIRSLAERSAKLGCVMQVLLPGESLIKRDCLTQMVPDRSDYALRFADDRAHAARILDEAAFADAASDLRSVDISGLLQQAERRSASSAP
jgi:hypothetical protein